MYERIICNASNSRMHKWDAVPIDRERHCITLPKRGVERSSKRVEKLWGIEDYKMEAGKQSVEQWIDNNKNNILINSTYSMEIDKIGDETSSRIFSVQMYVIPNLGSSRKEHSHWVYIRLKYRMDKQSIS